MKKAVKTKWLKALRSKDYKKTIGCLNDGTGMCCLGVLTDIYIKTKKTSWKKPGANSSSFSFGNSSGTLPIEVIEWSGVEDLNPDVVYKGNTMCISNLNDHEKLTFKQIANVIERQL